MIHEPHMKQQFWGEITLLTLFHDNRTIPWWWQEVPPAARLLCHVGLVPSNPRPPQDAADVEWAGSHQVDASWWCREVLLEANFNSQTGVFFPTFKNCFRKRSCDGTHTCWGRTCLARWHFNTFLTICYKHCQLQELELFLTGNVFLKVFFLFLLKHFFYQLGA